MIARSLLFVAMLAAVGSLRAAATRTWAGAGGDNEWTNTLNWTESKVPGIGDTAVFENTGVLSLRINRPSGYDVGATHFKFLGADVTIGSDNADNSLFFFGSSTCTVEVVAGTTVTCSNYLSMYNGNNIALAKKGGGTFRHVYRNNYIDNLKKLVVEGGRMGRDYLSNASHTLPQNKNIHVGEGADYFSSGYTSFGSNGGGLSIDGGTFTVGLGGAPSWWTFGTDGNRRPDVEIGESGGTFRAAGYGQYNSDNCRIRMYCAFKPASGVSDDGGVTIDLRDCGVGFMPLVPFSVSGPVTVKDGRLMISRYGDNEYPDLSNHPSFLGTGDLILDCSLLDYNDTNGNLAEGTLRLASGAGSVMRVRGSSEIRLRANTSKNVQHVVVGADGAAADSAFARVPGGALFLHDGGAVLDGNASTFKVNGGVATNEHTTLVKAPIFSEHAMGDNSGVFFLCYDAENGFYEFTDYATTLTEGEHSVVGGKIFPTLAADSTAHIAALHLEDWGSLTLNAGSCLTIGNGIDPACLLLGYEAHVKGTGAIDFGTSEGVIALGVMAEADANQYGGHSLECRLTGSGGVSYVARPAYGFRAVSVSGANDYTGETHISAATVVARNASAFSSGDVYVEGGYRNGGKIVFDRALTFANAFHVSGAGHRPKQYDADFFGRGALSFLINDVVLTGAVELTAKTEVSAMPNGASGTFAGTISGDRLMVRPGEGSIILAANNTYTGGTEVVSAKIALAGTSPSLGTGRVKLDDGIVLFENTSPITFANPVEGNGSFRVLGSDVTFTVPQIKGGSPTVATAGTRVEFANGVARIIHPHGMAIVFK